MMATAGTISVDELRQKRAGKVGTGDMDDKFSYALSDPSYL